jgi:hypothetical protein
MGQTEAIKEMISRRESVDCLDSVIFQQLYLIALYLLLGRWAIRFCCMLYWEIKCPQRNFFTLQARILTINLR